MAEVIYVAVHPDLRQLLSEMAEARGVAMNEIAAELLATHPKIAREDLAKVPRKPLGRPRKEIAAS